MKFISSATTVALLFSPAYARLEATRTSNKERHLNTLEQNDVSAPPTIDCIYSEIDAYPIPGTASIEPDRKCTTIDGTTVYKLEGFSRRSDSETFAMLEDVESGHTQLSVPTSMIDKHSSVIQLEGGKDLGLRVHNSHNRRRKLTQTGNKKLLVVRVTALVSSSPESSPSSSPVKITNPPVVSPVSSSPESSPSSSLIRITNLSPASSSPESAPSSSLLMAANPPVVSPVNNSPESSPFSILVIILLIIILLLIMAIIMVIIVLIITRGKLQGLIDSEHRSCCYEYAKRRSIQNDITGNLMPLTGNFIRSQVDTESQYDSDSNEEDDDVTSNLTPMRKTIHRMKNSFNFMKRKRKRERNRNRNRKRNDAVTSQLYGMGSITQSTIERDSTSMEDRVHKTIERLLNLQKADSRTNNAEEKKIIDNCREVILLQSDSYRASAHDKNDKERKEKRKRKQNMRGKSSLLIDDSDNDTNDDDDSDDDSDDNDNGVISLQSDSYRASAHDKNDKERKEKRKRNREREREQNIRGMNSLLKEISDNDTNDDDDDDDDDDDEQNDDKWF